MKGFLKNSSKMTFSRYALIRMYIGHAIILFVVYSSIGFPTEATAQSTHSSKKIAQQQAIDRRKEIFRILRNARRKQLLQFHLRPIHMPFDFTKR